MQVENERQWQKKVNKNTYDISSIKRVTRKCLKVSRCSRAKQRQRNVQKKCAAHAKLLFCYKWDLLLCFHRSRFLCLGQTHLSVIYECPCKEGIRRAGFHCHSMFHQHYNASRGKTCGSVLRFEAWNCRTARRIWIGNFSYSDSDNIEMKI